MLSSPTCSTMPIEEMASNCPSGSSRQSCTRMSILSASPASAARRRALSACGGDNVMPTTETPWLRAACSAKLPQPQPTSSTRWPSSRPSFVHTSSSFASWASSSVVAPREKIAQL